MKHTIVEVKEDALKGYRISGYAAVFGNLDSHNDVIVKGAFSRTLAKWRGDPNLSKIFLFSRHNEDKTYLPIGKITDLFEDDKGLWLEAELTPNLEEAEYWKARLDQGDFVGMSVGYFGDNSEVIDGIRYMYELDVVEISLVDKPSNAEAFVTEIKDHESPLEADDVLNLIGALRATRGY